MKKLSLKMALFTLSLTPVIGFAADQTCHKNTSEMKVLVLQEQKTNTTACQFITQKSEENFAKKHILFSSKNNIQLCEDKLNTYITKMTKKGWTCLAIEEKKPEIAAPPVVQSPAVEKEVTNTLDSTNKSWSFSAAPIFSFTRMDASGASSSSISIASKSVSPGVKLSAGKAWPANWNSEATLAANWLSLETNSNVDSLDKSQDFQWRTALGTSHEAYSRFHFGGEVGIARQLFLTRPATTTISIDGIELVDLTATSQMQLFETHDIHFGAGLNLSYLLSGSKNQISADSGYGYHAEINAAVSKIGHAFLASAYFEQRYQNTTAYDWHTTELGLLVSMGF